jgi:hypothetical protein
LLGHQLLSLCHAARHWCVEDPGASFAIPSIAAEMRAVVLQQASP